MKDNEETNAPAQTEAKPKAVVEIIRGRMPVVVVALIRFGDNRNKTTKELATLFGTTVGKIDDIKKSRNFAYVTATFRPTAAQKTEGIEWLKRHPYYDKVNADSLINELDALPEASADETAAFEAARTKARGQNTKTKTGETADGGGGNRRGRKKSAPTEILDAGPDNDAVLHGVKPTEAELLS